MVRSLYSGISGLRSHQVSMDVSANNIANVNTTGFKAGRVTFEESMAQLLKGAMRPPGNAGGTNPMQVGLGMTVGSIDTMLTQGNLQSTGQITDLALEGRAYFVFNSGTGNFFSRNGALQFDSTGRIVSPTNGFGLQGMMADSNGEYPAGTRIGNIRIPFGEKAPARDTSVVQFSSNLDSDSEALGTVMHTNRFLAVAGATVGGDDDTLTSLYDANGNSLGIRENDVITFSESGSGTSDTFTVTSTSTLSDFATALETYLNTNVSVGSSVTVQADGTIDVSAGVTDVNNLMVRSNRPGSDSYVSNTFNWGSSITAGGSELSGALRAPAQETDSLASIYDAQGNALGLEEGDQLTINGAVGGQPVSQGLGEIDFNNDGVTANYTAVTDLQSLLDLIQNTFGLPQNDGTLQNNLSVSINNADTRDDRLPDGSIVVRGQQGLAFALSNVNIGASNANLNATTPNAFIANTRTVNIQDARDVGVHSTSTVVYDDSGDSHIMTTTFTHSGQPGEWLWEITMEGGEQILGGNTGRITFGQDGTPAAFTFDDGSTSFQFDPMNGANTVGIDLNVGSPGSLSGITQFRSPSTTAVRYQDGYPMGKLTEISIDEYGEISGVFTNGISRSLARIYIADFNNPSGLLKVGDSMFAQSNNSGEPVLLRPGVGSSTKIKPGALEMSNVELATEFTTLITTQRGYQANARVITTSDTLLQELVQLVR